MELNLAARIVELNLVQPAQPPKFDELAWPTVREAARTILETVQLAPPLDPDRFVLRATETNQDYLGDGVYAAVDSAGQIWLRTHEGHEVALDDRVVQSLERYVKRVREAAS